MEKSYETDNPTFDDHCNAAHFPAFSSPTITSSHTFDQPSRPVNSASTQYSNTEPPWADASQYVAAPVQQNITSGQQSWPGSYHFETLNRGSPSASVWHCTSIQMGSTLASTRHSTTNANMLLPYAAPLPGAQPTPLQYQNTNSAADSNTPGLHRSVPFNMDILQQQLPNRDMIKCNEAACGGKTFGRIPELKRHNQSVHQGVGVWCPIEGCKRSKGGQGKPFRKDNLSVHMKAVHENLRQKGRR